MEGLAGAGDLLADAVATRAGKVHRIVLGVGVAIDRLRAAGIPGERGALQEAPKRWMPPPRLEVHKPSAICFGATRLVSIPRRFIDIVQLFGRR